MKLHVLLAASCIAASISAHASNPFEAVELSDQELSQLRGRFVMPGRIVHFGVTMSSQWQNASGQVLGGSVSMQVNENMFEPQFTVSLLTNDNGQGAPTAGNGQVTGGAGLSEVQGVSQSVRAAGDFNTALNGVSINISRGSSAPTASGGSQGFSGVIEGSSIAGSVRISPNAGGLQIAIQALGQGNSLQQMGSGGLQQHTVIGGSSNTVTNLATLDVVLRDRGLNGDQLQLNWNQLRDLRPVGY